MFEPRIEFVCILGMVLGSLTLSCAHERRLVPLVNPTTSKSSQAARSKVGRGPDGPDQCDE